jgi:FKBP-type peptidyl-prolyl cis-trans isomerase SlyD
MTTIDVDHNHPLAGKALHFDIEVIAVRAAAPEELAHGHAHPGDGHVHG